MKPTAPAIGATPPLVSSGVHDTEGNLPSTTTTEQDRKTSGQRKVNLVWELTQAIIAVSVTGAVIWSALSGKDSQILSNAFTLIIAIYFVRMNHTKTGGIGGTDSR
jgi:hypothetical protein